MKKYIETIKKSVLGGLVFTLTVFGAVYAASVISYTQTVNPGDVMTAEWANSIKNILPIDTTKITDNTITESDISDTFKARDADLLDGVDSSDYATKSYVASNSSWPAGHYCILRAGGSCPAGFTMASGYVGAVSGFNVLTTNYYSSTNVGDSYLGAHGGGTFPYGALADVSLFGCCK